MPTYTYTCPDKHTHDAIVPIAERHAERACPSCGAPAVNRGIYAFATPLPEGHAKLETGAATVTVRGTTSHDIRSVDLECTGCQKRYEDVYDAAKETPGPCPTCGAVGTVLVGQLSVAHANEYPRFDRGLGLWLRSESHRQQVCKERGLTPVDGDFDMDRALGRIEEERDADIRAYQEYVDKVEHSPDYAPYRELRAKGRYDAYTKPSDAALSPISRPIRQVTR